MHKRSGFSLIELMIALTIIAILAAIAIPSYRQYVIRGHRRAAQTSMVDIANREQQYFAANRAFADKATLGYVEPTEVSDNYTWDVDPDNAATPPDLRDHFHGNRRAGGRRQPHPQQRRRQGTLRTSGSHEIRKLRISQRGTSLVEVLVTMVILAIGLLALAGLQARLHVLQIESYQRAQALILLQDMTSRIVNNRYDAASYVTAAPLGTGAACPALHGDAAGS